MKKTVTIPAFFVAFLLLSFQIPTIFSSKNIEDKGVMLRRGALPPVEVQAVVTGSLPQVEVGYCQLGQSTITFTNLGDGADSISSVITDLSLGIALGNSFQLSDGAFEITGIRIAGVDLTTLDAMNGLDGNAQFSTDPDGAEGLKDVDNDGFYDDLELGGSVEVTAFFRLDCSAANSTAGNCLNNLMTSLSAKMDYSNLGIPESFSLDNYSNPTNSHTSSESFVTPDAFLSVDTFYITQRIQRTINDFGGDCSGEGLLEAQLALPLGVNPILSEISLSKDGDELQLFSSVNSSGIVVLKYETGLIANISGEYELTLAFTTDCSVSAGLTSFPFSFRHYCPSCDCSHIWYCKALEGPQLHATSPPCPPSSVPSCDKGIRIMGFEAERTTFGFEDSDYSIPFSPQLANKKVGLACDSIRMKSVSVVGTNPIPDSVGIVVTYDNPDGSTSLDETFLFHQGLVRISHLGNDFTCNLTPANLMVEDDAGAKTLTFDLNSCLTGLGFALAPGDSVIFIGDFVINKSGPLPVNFSQVPNFRSYTYVQQSGQQIICDNFGETFSIGRTEATFEAPPVLSTNPSGCENGEMHFQLAVPENDFIDFFGDELRASNKVSSFGFTFDPLFLQTYDNVEIEVSIPGHPIFSDNFFPIRSLSDFPSGNYLATFDTLDYAPALNVLEGSSFDVRLRFTPNCQAEINDHFDFASQIIFDDRYYAESIGNGNCVENRMENTARTLDYSQAPQLSLSGLTPLSDTVQNAPAVWNVQLCNDSPLGDAVVTWLAVENPSGQLMDINLTNVTDPSAPVQLFPLPYPDGTFAFIPGIAAGSCYNIQIEASIDFCGEVEFDLSSGWNCGPYSQPSWNPANNGGCQETGITLEIINDLPAPLSVDFHTIMSECDGSGGELISLSGSLLSMDDIPLDDFTMNFVFDENGNGQVDGSEPILAQPTITDSIGPSAPLNFEFSFLATPEQACQMLLEVSAVNTELCEDVLAPLPAPQILNAGDDQFPCTLSGTSFTTVLGSPDCGNTDYVYSWTALPPADVDDLSDPSIAEPTLALGWSNFLGQTLSFILETERITCGISTFDTIQIHLPTTEYSFFDGDSIVLQATDCQSLVELCLGLTDEQLPNMQITNNGLPYPSAALVPCSDTLNAVQLGTGYHELVATDTVQNCSDTIFVKVQCSETETLVIDILLHETDTICFNNDEIIGTIQTLDNFCLDGSFVEYEVFEDSCLILTGNWVGSENACVEICDNIGFCDTTFLQINVLHPLPNGVKDSIVIEQLSEYCFDANLLNIAGPIESIENICPDQSGTSVDFTIDGAANCAQYFGVNLGVDTACVRLCDAAGNCDTVNVCVSVIPGDVIYDTVFIEVDTNVFCLTESLLPGTIISVEDICPENNGDEVQFVIDGTCISYFGDVVGLDTACIRFEDDLGNVGLINLIVSVVRTIPETICDSVFIGQNRTICLDTSELPGLFDYIEEICPDEGTANVDVIVDPVTLCVNYRGVYEGRDSACIVVCDDFGFCDTTYLCLTVAPYFDLPTLGNDTTQTQKGTLVNIDVLANDTLFGGITDIFILNPPISGTVAVNLDNSISYTPDEPFCARWDNFTYVACNPNGCDTATVSVFIECAELTVFSAVSPNNDGVNDFFYIAKIEDFPDNTLWVYNRWGNLVFEKSNYKNNWPGTWGEDIELPDGTYYYVLEWSDGGTITVQRGYFEMFR